MEEKPKRSVGRPTDYRPEYCDMLVEHMAQGFSFESFGAKVDQGRMTLYAWRDAQPEFQYAFERGKEKHLEHMEKIASEHMVEHFQGPKINTALFKLFMANIHGWREKTDSEVKSSSSVTIHIDSDDAEF